MPSVLVSAASIKPNLRPDMGGGDLLHAAFTAFLTEFRAPSASSQLVPPHTYVRGPRAQEYDTSDDTEPRFSG